MLMVRVGRREKAQRLAGVVVGHCSAGRWKLFVMGWEPDVAGTVLELVLLPHQAEQVGMAELAA
jgi:hypothetical protein